MSNPQQEQKGLNAVPPAQATTPAAPAKSNRKVLVIAGLIALVAIGAGGRMWYRSANFVDTENAYITGHVHPVSSRIAGVVTDGTDVISNVNMLLHNANKLFSPENVDSFGKTLNNLEQTKIGRASCRERV